MTDSEKDRLNKMAAEIMGWEQKQGLADWWFPKSKSVTLEDAVLDWNPYELLDHTKLVLREMRKKGWEWSLDTWSYDRYRCKMERGNMLIRGYALKESHAIMKVIEKAWEGARND